MSGDLRGFVYALEPVRQKAQWQLDALQRELAAATAKAAALRDETLALEARLQALALEARASAAARIDPSQSLARLAYLTEARQRLAKLSAERDAADAAQAELLRRVGKQRLGLDAIDDDRDRCREEHLAEQHRLAILHADDDWLARAGWRPSPTAGREAA